MNINLDETIYSEISIKIKVDPESELSIKCKELLSARIPEWFSIRSGIKVIAEGYFEVIDEAIIASDNDITNIYTIIHAEKPKRSFKDIYRGYVIKQECGDYFIGPDTDRKFTSIREQEYGDYYIGPARKFTSIREHAVRFTKKEAVEYIQSGLFCKDGAFIIEDAK